MKLRHVAALTSSAWPLGLCAAALILVTACQVAMDPNPGAAPGPDATADGELDGVIDGVDQSGQPAEPRAWLPLGTRVSGEKGETASWSLAMPPGDDVLALRLTTVPLDTGLCMVPSLLAHDSVLWLDDTELGSQDDPPLVARPSQADGLWVWPVPGGSVDTPRSLTVVARVSDCATRLPVDADEGVSLTLQGATWVAPAPERLLSLPLAFVDASSQGSDGDLFAEALAVAGEIFAGARVQVHLVESHALPASAPVLYGPQDLSPLASLLPPDLQWPALVLTPCLHSSDPIYGTESEPMGFTPRIPGGLAPAGVADGIFLRVETCGISNGPLWAGPQGMGRVLAHELGHFLGLFHASESEEEGTIMEAEPLAVDPGFLSPEQIVRLRVHPLLEPAFIPR